VNELSPQGRLVRSFGDGGSVVLPSKFVGSFTTEVYGDGEGGVDVFGFVSFMGCGGPLVVRVRSDGSLDASFDAAITRSIASLTPHRLLFEPALVTRSQPGSFALIGEITNYCGAARRVVSRAWPSGCCRRDGSTARMAATE